MRHVIGGTSLHKNAFLTADATVDPVRVQWFVEWCVSALKGHYCMRPWFLTIGFLVSIVLSSVSASAQSNSNSAGYAELVKLFEAAKIIIKKNGAYWHADKWGVLSQSQWADVQLGALNNGWEYGLIGFCDSGCGTFDLVLYDGNNRLIARGAGKPELEVKPRQTQNYWA
ncbi:MAG: hypothetical protein ACJAU6_003077 [Alphaproteobacteria bacterium]|jgi:hypothetical protein